ncbi:MAG TPA: tetratricopeptide repeat protein [Candidatus Eisenbacteria bacterium]|nr:tetratricopeptide repeat protein [Candidatus Eisenbacteria bacterium]
MARRIGSWVWRVAVVAIAFAFEPLAAASSDPLEEVKGLLKAGKYAEAEPKARSLLTKAEAARDSLRMARAQDVLLEALWRGDHEYDPAWQAMAEEAIGIKERILGPDDLEVASSLNNLGAMLFTMRNFAAARPPYERALAIRQKSLGPDHADVGISLANLGGALINLNEFAAARDTLTRAITVLEKPPGPNTAAMVNALGDLAGALKGMGDYAAARSTYERTLAVGEKVFGAEADKMADLLSNYANLLWWTADQAESRRVSERAHAIRVKTLPPDHPNLAFDQTQLGMVSYKLGDYAAAQRYYRDALALYEKVFGPNHFVVAIVLANLANLERDTGQPEAARPLIDRALAIDDSTLGPASPQLALHLIDLARLLTVMGDPAAARTACERALAIQEKTYGPESYALSDALTLSANLARDLGDLPGARARLERALALRSKAFGIDHPDVAYTRALLSRVAAMEGHRPEALDLALEAERVSREHLRLTSRSISEREALKYAALPRGSGLANALALAADGLDGPSRRRVLDALTRSRAVVLDEMAARHRVLSGVSNPEVASLARAVAGARARLANLVLRGAGNQKADAYRKLVDGARDEKEGAERALAEKSESFAQEMSRARLGLDDVAAGLPKGSALVAFVEYPRHVAPGLSSSTATVPSGTPPSVAPSARGSKEPAQINAYLAFVLRAGEAEPRVVPLGDAAELDPLVGRWKAEAVGRSLASQPAQAEGNYRDAGVALRQRVWDPVESSLTRVTRVFVVPDGSLNLMNFAALPLDDGRYVLERGPLIHYLSAERDLVPSGTPQRGAGLLALGAPDFDATSMFASLSPGAAAATAVAAATTASSGVDGSPAMAVATRRFAVSGRRVPISRR